MTATVCLDTLLLMDLAYENEPGSKRHKRLLEQLDKMVESGRLTEQEAARLRAAPGPDEFENVLRDVRVRHAGTRLASAVGDGGMSQDEADGFLVRLKNGEHPRSLRAHLGKLRPRRPTSGPVPS